MSSLYPMSRYILCPLSFCPLSPSCTIYMRYAHCPFYNICLTILYVPVSLSPKSTMYLCPGFPPCLLNILCLSVQITLYLPCPLYTLLCDTPLTSIAYVVFISDDIGTTYIFIFSAGESWYIGKIWKCTMLDTKRWLIISLKKLLLKKIHSVCGTNRSLINTNIRNFLHVIHYWF